MDPSFHVLSDLKKFEAAIKGELLMLAEYTSEAERIARFAINDIHTIANKHDGSISERDAEIKNVLISMSIDLAHHLDAVYKLITITWDNYRVCFSVPSLISTFFQKIFHRIIYSTFHYIASQYNL